MITKELDDVIASQRDCIAGALSLVIKQMRKDDMSMDEMLRTVSLLQYAALNLAIKRSW